MYLQNAKSSTFKSTPAQSHRSVSRRRRMAPQE